MGVDSRGAWIFIHGTDIVERGLIVLFFGLLSFFVIPSPGNFSADALGKVCSQKKKKKKKKKKKEDFTKISPYFS